MADSKSETAPEESTLYREFLDEREEILRHKWVKSEPAGHDIGFEGALVDWALHARESWKKDYLKNKKTAS